MKKVFAVALAALLIAGCARGPVIEKGKFVSLHYRGTLDDGSEFDSSHGGEPLEFIFGVGLMIPGFEAGIAGLRAGAKKAITVKAADAYGEYDNNLVVAVPRKQFPPEMSLEPGMQIFMQSQTGNPVPVRIKEVKDKEVILDQNPPFAGKNLNFEVEIIEVREPTAGERKLLLGEGGQP